MAPHEGKLTASTEVYLESSDISPLSHALNGDLYHNQAAMAAAEVTVQVHALSAGSFCLPEEQFVSPAVPGARSSVPSLCFLIQHTHPETAKTTRIVFDLGLRRDVKRYPTAIQNHMVSREPYSTEAHVVRSLQAGGLSPNDIDYVIYSHVHWDHVGEPRDFPKSTFVVGHGSLDLLSGSFAHLRGNHSFFESDLLDPSRTIELADQTLVEKTLSDSACSLDAIDFHRPWQRVGTLPSAIDVFNDGSLYIVHAPGHLPGHINLLAKTAPNGPGHPTKRVYLAGDACHDRRILRYEKDIGEWKDVHGQVCCIHADKEKAKETIASIRVLEEEGVEVIFAHDAEWEMKEENKSRFFGQS